MDQHRSVGVERPYAHTQDGAPVMQPISSIEMDMPTDPKRIAGGTIKVYHQDVAECFRLMEEYAQKYVTLLEMINNARKANTP